jgi:three-Cys-motif partner protein
MECSVENRVVTLTRGEEKANIMRIVRGQLQFDEIGVWSELKLDIIQEYASAYSRILAAQTNPRFHHVYVDAFAGAGVHLSKANKEFIPGSPLNALKVRPPFREYHLIDIKHEKIKNLRRLVGSREDVFLHSGNCNKFLFEDVFPRIKYEDYWRGLCILDPYGLNLSWSVIRRAGEMKTLEIFLNFPVMDINRNVLWRDPDAVDDVQRARMTAFWGDNSWPKFAYGTDLFGNPDKQSNETIAEAFRKRLNEVAGFARVPKPIPMRNSRGAIVYYLFFASQKDTAEHIVLDIFRKYENRGAI